ADTAIHSMDPKPFLRYGSASTARNRALRCERRAPKIIGKLCAGKPHAQFERGLRGNGSAFVLIPRHNLPMPMPALTHRFIETNGIRMHCAEAGSGPLVVLCHGFPELWYS